MSSTLPAKNDNVLQPEAMMGKIVTNSLSNALEVFYRYLASAVRKFWMEYCEAQKSISALKLVGAGKCPNH